eukprot:244788-Pelagomonas_calceolata.AAC.1
MDVDGVYKAGCKWCESVFNCHFGIIKSHELGVKHRAKVQQHHRTAAAKSSFQQQLNAMQQKYKPSFCLLCQQRHVQLFECMEQLDKMKQRVKRNYISEHRYSKHVFQRLHKLINISPEAEQGTEQAQLA